MDISVEVNWIKKELDTIKDPSIIESIKLLLTQRYDVVEETKVEYIKAYNKDLELSEKEIEEGDLMTENEVSELIRKWKG